MSILQVARCTKIINPNTDDARYVINIKQIAKVRIMKIHSAPCILPPKPCTLRMALLLIAEYDLLKNIRLCSL